MGDPDGQPEIPALSVFMVVGREDVEPPMEPPEVLDRLESLAIHEWADVSGTGPGGEYIARTAEEFHELFEARDHAEKRETGDADVGPTTLEELVNRVVEQRAVVERHERDVERLREITSEQRDDIERLRERIESIQSTVSRLQRQVDERG